MNWNRQVKKIPKQVKINNKTYKVLWVDKFPNDPGQLGEADFNNNTIKINSDQTNREACHTYFHELLHCFAQEYGFVLSEKNVRKAEQSLEDWLKLGNLWKR